MCFQSLRGKLGDKPANTEEGKQEEGKEGSRGRLGGLESKVDAEKIQTKRERKGSMKLKRMYSRKWEGALLTVAQVFTDCESILAGAEEDPARLETFWGTHTHTSSGLCLKPPWPHGWNWGEIHLLSFLLVSKVPPPVPEEAGGGQQWSQADTLVTKAQVVFIDNHGTDPKLSP